NADQPRRAAVGNLSTGLNTFQKFYISFTPVRCWKKVNKDILCIKKPRKEEKAMPSTYAHYRFGCEVFRRLPKEMAGSVRRYRPLYLAGLHGPDLMFYYKPLIAHPVNQIGYELHNSTGKDF